MKKFIPFAGHLVNIDHISTIRFKQGYYLDETDSVHLTLANGVSLSEHALTEEEFLTRTEDGE